MYKDNWDYPVILGGKKAFIVLSRRGVLSTPWSRYGPKIDFGGLYTPPIRATGPIIPLIQLNDKMEKLGDHVTKSMYFGSHLEASYLAYGIKIKSISYVPHRLPAALIVFDIESHIEEPIDLKLYLETWGGPLEQDGILPDNTEIYLYQGGAAYEVDEWSVVVQSNIKPTNIELDTREYKKPGPIKTLPTANPDKIRNAIITWKLNKLGEDGKIVMSISSSDKGLGTALKYSREAIKNWAYYLEENIHRYRDYLENTLSIETPSPEINLAYKLAKAALETLKSEQPEIGVAAGYPWFARFWSRDAAWIIPTLLLIGDHGTAREYIDIFLRYQAKREYKVLGGLKGEVLMHYGYKSLFYYGAADSTLYYPILINKYLKTTGDIEYVKKRWKKIINLVEWGYYKDLDGDQLIEHELREPAKFFFIDTTWMDTIYRGIRPIEIQALWSAALRSAAEMATQLGIDKQAKKWLRESEQVKQKLMDEYWNSREGYFYDRILGDGSKDPSIRPNALIALYLLDIPRELAIKALDRLKKPDILTPWGLRTLSSYDMKYAPDKYHNGMVWPLVTGWLALANYKYGRKDEGYSLIETMARQIIREGGMYAEVYRGDREEPQYSCILQAWSITLYIQSIIEGMMGIDIDSINNRLYLDPKPPNQWSWIILRNIAVGGAKLDIDMDLNKGIIAISNSGDKKITVSIWDSEIEMPPKSKKVIEKLNVD